VEQIRRERAATARPTGPCVPPAAPPPPLSPIPFPTHPPIDTHRQHHAHPCAHITSLFARLHDAWYFGVAGAGGRGLLLHWSGAPALVMLCVRACCYYCCCCWDSILKAARHALCHTVRLCAQSTILPWPKPGGSWLRLDHGPPCRRRHVAVLRCVRPTQVGGFARILSPCPVPTHSPCPQPCARCTLAICLLTFTMPVE
jgi:hypothetical protein